uniref:Uncharacterized protein n=1 Tax=Anguilla anguilla TaxID=7936 RepID=A0A0E9UBP7_ANGAN
MQQYLFNLTIQTQR